METKIPVTIGKLEALILANKSLLKLGKVRELDENKLMVSGSMRYGLQRIKINISIIEEDQVMLKIIAEGDDVWEKGASSAINKLMSEIKSNTENAQPETLTNGETLITSKIESDVVEEKSKIETKAEQINTKNDKESSTLDENIEHREIKSPKKSGNKPNNYRYYIGIACFLVVLIYYFKLNRTNERNANETEWTSDYRGTTEVSNQNQLSDDSEKSKIIEKEKIKLVEFEIHTRGDGLNNLFDLEKNQYHFANWYHLTYRKGISPAIVFTSNGREASFSTFEIEKTKEEFIIDPYMMTEPEIEVNRTNLMGKNNKKPAQDTELEGSDSRISNRTLINRITNRIFVNNENFVETLIHFNENGQMNLSNNIVDCRYSFNYRVHQDQKIEALFVISTCGAKSSDANFTYNYDIDALIMHMNDEKFIFRSVF